MLNRVAQGTEALIFLDKWMYRARHICLQELAGTETVSMQKRSHDTHDIVWAFNLTIFSFRGS